VARFMQRALARIRSTVDALLRVPLAQDDTVPAAIDETLARVPAVGDVVLYTLSDGNAQSINGRRTDATRNVTAATDGSQIYTGNRVSAREVYPMVITRVWGTTPQSAVNGQVLLDGNDVLWATSISAGDGEGHFAWRPTD
jgi:hypothetical protein